MAGHVVGSFHRMDEVVLVFRAESFEIFMQVGPGRRIRILINDQAGAGVGDEHGADPILDSGLPHNFFNLTGDFIGSFTTGVDGE